MPPLINPKNVFTLRCHTVENDSHQLMLEAKINRLH